MGNCPSCGQQIIENASFCSGCGENLLQGNITVDSEFTSQLTEEERHISLFIGKKYSYFANKWQQMEQKKSSNSWNWAAFFLGLAWFGYRKMHQYALVLIGVMALITILEFATGLGEEPASNAINIVIAVMLGTLGNTLYKQHSNKIIREVKATVTSPELIEQELVARGGTSLLFAFVYPIAALVLMIIVSLPFF